LTVAFVDPGDASLVESLVLRIGKIEFVPIPLSATPPAQGSRIDPSLPVLFRNDQIAAVEVDPDTSTLGPGERAFSFTLEPDATRLFAAYTAAHLGEYVAIVLDGAVISAPVIRAPIGDGKGRISGILTASELDEIVTVLKFGPLPLLFTRGDPPSQPCPSSSP
jgi:preprotein translocase subunit SecD